MSKVAALSGSGPHYRLRAEARTATFVHSSTPAPARPPKKNTFTPRPIRRPAAYQIRNLIPLTSIQDPNRKTETFRHDEDADVPATATPPPAPASRQRDPVPASASASAPASAPVLTHTPLPPPSAQPLPAEQLGEAIPLPQRDPEYISPQRSTTPKPTDAPSQPDIPPVIMKQPAASPPRDFLPVMMTPIPEEPSAGDQIDELKSGLQALLSKMEVIQRETPDPGALADKEQEIESLRTYVASLETRHKRAKELLTNREIQVLQLEGQLAGERSSAAYFKAELESYEEERRGFEEGLKKERQSVARLEEEKRQVNELLQESESSNVLLYDELVASEAENESLVKQLAEANTVINRLRDEKAEDAFFIQRTQQLLAESEARNSVLLKNAEAPQADAVDAKKTADMEEKLQKERDQWADIFDSQRVQISKFEDKLIALQNEIEQFQAERAKHAETESVNQMLRTRVIFLQFQRVTLTKKTTNIESQLSTAQKAVVENQDRLAALQKAYERSDKLLQLEKASRSKVSSPNGWEPVGHEEFM